jgi:hypothetical protein
VYETEMSRRFGVPRGVIFELVDELAKTTGWDVAEKLCWRYLAKLRKLGYAIQPCPHKQGCLLCHG